MIRMKVLAAVGVAAMFLAVACGDEEGSTSTGSSSSDCERDWECIGGSCQCTTEGAEGTACCDPDDCGDDSNACDAVCEVCD